MLFTTIYCYLFIIILRFLSFSLSTRSVLYTYGQYFFRIQRESAKAPSYYVIHHKWYCQAQLLDACSWRIILFASL